MPWCLWSCIHGQSHREEVLTACLAPSSIFVVCFYGAWYGISSSPNGVGNKSFVLSVGTYYYLLGADVKQRRLDTQGTARSGLPQIGSLHANQPSMQNLLVMLSSLYFANLLGVTVICCQHRLIWRCESCVALVPICMHEPKFQLCHTAIHTHSRDDCCYKYM